METLRASAPARLTMAAALSLGSIGLCASCADRTGQADGASVVPGGDPRLGRAAIRTLGCGGCHIVPGVRAADGLVGPPLIHFSGRMYIAGEFPNTPENLVSWVMDPPALSPGTAMPDLDVSEQQARDIAAYLYTLR